MRMYVTVVMKESKRVTLDHFFQVFSSPPVEFSIVQQQDGRTITQDPLLDPRSSLHNS